MAGPIKTGTELFESWWSRDGRGAAESMTKGPNKETVMEALKDLAQASYLAGTIDTRAEIERFLQASVHGGRVS